MTQLLSQKDLSRFTTCVAVTFCLLISVHKIAAADEPKHDDVLAYAFNQSITESQLQERFEAQKQEAPEGLVANFEYNREQMFMRWLYSLIGADLDERCSVVVTDLEIQSFHQSMNTFSNLRERIDGLDEQTIQAMKPHMNTIADANIRTYKHNKC
ncbi:hypothetical protein PN836_009970 [Ningiella sp. W23]|uniref:hypothetical protein n=1 Tax=Ningiella sp. W23 TaxID=3023715 RepID=UPI0037571039